MTKLAGLFLSANLLTTLGFPAQAWNATHLEPDARPRLTVRIYNYARVHQGTLEGAERVARQVFQQAGIETMWLHCALNQQEVADNPTCEREFGPDSLLIRLLPERMARKLTRGSELGYAILFEHDSFETEAYAFYDRAKELAETRIASITILTRACAGPRDGSPAAGRWAAFLQGSDESQLERKGAEAGLHRGIRLQPQTGPADTARRGKALSGGKVAGGLMVKLTDMRIGRCGW